MRILFRVDSSLNIGLGHMMRSLLLAKRLKNENENLQIVFLCLNLEGNINKKVLEEGFTLDILESNTIIELINNIKKRDCDLVIIDSYEFNYKMEKELCSNIFCKTLIFDDMYWPHCSSMVLNHGIQVKKSSYNGLLKKDVKLFFGSKSTLLRDEFFEVYNFKKNSKSIAIILGGNDVYNLSLKLYNLLKQVDASYKISIITTSVNPNLKDLKRVKNFELYIDISNVAEILSKHSLIVCASGGNLFEVMSLKLPFINIQVASNQQSIVDFLEDKNIKTSIKKEELSKEFLIKKLSYIKNEEIYDKLQLNFSKTKLAKEILREIE